MKQKIFQSLFLIVFFCIIWYFYGSEYWDFHDVKKQQKEFQIQVSQDIENFSFETIGELEDIELFSTPDLGLLDDIVERIDNAQEKIYVEIYIFTERDMRDALVRAHERWLEVKILLENNPYKAPYLNDKHFNTFKEAGIDVRWSDPLNYSLNHSKFMIIDNYAYVSTGNFSYSLFKYNKDFLVWIKQKDIVASLEQLFINDYSHTKKWVIHSNLVISPEYSRSRLEYLVSNAQESIDFYFPYIADNDFEELLFIASEKWIKIRWIVEEKFYQENLDIIKKFSDHNISIHFLDTNKLHAKMILVDWRYVYVGSINFSRYSFDENREVGIIIANNKIIKQIQNIFESDF